MNNCNVIIIYIIILVCGDATAAVEDKKTFKHLSDKISNLKSKHVKSYQRQFSKPSRVNPKIKTVIESPITSEWLIAIFGDKLVQVYEISLEEEFELEHPPFLSASVMNYMKEPWSSLFRESRRPAFKNLWSISALKLRAKQLNIKKNEIKWLASLIKLLKLERSIEYSPEPKYSEELAEWRYLWRRSLAEAMKYTDFTSDSKFNQVIKKEDRLDFSLGMRARHLSNLLLWPEQFNLPANRTGRSDVEISSVSAISWMPKFKSQNLDRKLSIHSEIERSWRKRYTEYESLNLNLGVNYLYDLARQGSEIELAYLFTGYSMQQESLSPFSFFKAHHVMMKATAGAYHYENGSKLKPSISLNLGKHDYQPSTLRDLNAYEVGGSLFLDYSYHFYYPTISLVSGYNAYHTSDPEFTYSRTHAKVISRHYPWYVGQSRLELFEFIEWQLRHWDKYLDNGQRETLSRIGAGLKWYYKNKFFFNVSSSYNQRTKEFISSSAPFDYKNNFVRSSLDFFWYF